MRQQVLHKIFIRSTPYSHSTTALPITHNWLQMVARTLAFGFPTHFQPFLIGHFCFCQVPMCVIASISLAVTFAEVSSNKKQFPKFHFLFSLLQQRTTVISVTFVFQHFHKCYSGKRYPLDGFHRFHLSLLVFILKG